MINFRYHVVSVIGIFVALAVGIVLGAGPLQARINSAMGPGEQSQAASEQAAELSAQAGAEAAGLKELATARLGQSLASKSVVVLTLPGARSEDVTSVRETLTGAGAQVVGAITLSDNWDSQAMSQYRTTLSATLASHLSNPAAATASADAVIGYSIAQVVSSTDSESNLLSQILTDKTTPIMTIDEDPRGAGQALVAIGPRPDAQGSKSTAAPAVERSADAWAGLGQAVGATSGVVLGDASAKGSLVAQLRAHGVAVTTVDSVGTTLGAVDTALALASPSASARAYGVGAGAQSAVPSGS